MYTEINNKIYDLKEKLRIKEKLDSLKNMVETELNKKRSQERQLKKQLLKEEKDVTKLEGGSFSSIFLSLTGKKDEKFDKEREEFLEAKLRYEECLQSIKELEEELEYAKNELRKYSGIKEEYDKAIKEKESLLINEDSDRGRTLRERLDRINDLKLEIKEIKEAISAGRRASSSLLEMRNRLDSAKGWGVWDMLGGGLISNIAKHSAIDDANKIGLEAKRLLRVFQKELADVNEYTDIEVELSGFTKFADFFFDGFFVDWFVQSKITSSLDNLNRVYRNIDNIINNLETNLSKSNGELSKVNQDIKNLLELE